MGILERLLGWLADRAERGRQKRIASRCSDVRTAVDVVRHFTRFPESTEVVVDAPEGKGLFTRADVPRLKHAGKSSVGEQVFARALVGAGNYGFPGTWTGDRLEQIQHLKTWVFIAIRSIWDRISRHEPNTCFVTHDGVAPGTHHKSLAGYASSLTALNYGGKNPHGKALFGNWRYTKSLHAVKPHEVVVPAGPNHALPSLFRRPNKHDVSFEFWSELGLFLELTGNAYIWAVPSNLGLLDRTYKAAELWILPSHWVWPVIGKDEMVRVYRIMPMVGGQMFEVPPEDIIHLKFKSPIHKIDGFSHLNAGAEWIDTQESVNRSRFFSFKNGAFPLGAIEMGQNYADLDDDGLERMYAKLFARFQGEHNFGRPMIMPPDMKYNQLQINPQEMAYFQTSDQLRDYILALWRVPKEVAGTQDAGSQIALYGPLRQFSENALIPRLTYLGQVLTEKLASRWDRRLRVWWDDPAGEDPQQRNADLKLLYDCQAISPNEMRSQYGLEPWSSGGDNPIAPSTLVEMPLETGESMNMGGGDASGGSGGLDLSGLDFGNNAASPPGTSQRPGLPVPRSPSNNGRVPHA